MGGVGCAGGAAHPAPLLPVPPPHSAHLPHPRRPAPLIQRSGSAPGAPPAPRPAPPRPAAPTGGGGAVGVGGGTRVGRGRGGPGHARPWEREGMMGMLSRSERAPRLQPSLPAPLIEALISQVLPDPRCHHGHGLGVAQGPPPVFALCPRSSPTSIDPISIPPTAPGRRKTQRRALINPPQDRTPGFPAPPPPPPPGPPGSPPHVLPTRCPFPCPPHIQASPLPALDPSWRSPRVPAAITKAFCPGGATSLGCSPAQHWSILSIPCGAVPQEGGDAPHAPLLTHAGGKCDPNIGPAVSSLGSGVPFWEGGWGGRRGGRDDTGRDAHYLTCL